jgi:rfaE bifunctional protein kinase chain/domain
MVYTQALLREIVGQFERTRVLVVGDVMVDEYIYGNSVRISPEAPVPVVSSYHRVITAGGAGNAAANMRSLGAQALLVAVTGHDPLAAELRGVLDEQGIDPSGIISDPGRPTSLKTRVVAGGQQMLRIDREVTSSLPDTIEHALERAACERLPDVDVVLLSDYCKGVISSRIARTIIREARLRGKPIIADSKRSAFEIFEGVSVMTPNIVEAEVASNHKIVTDDDLAYVGNMLLDQLQSEAVLITRGAAGVSLFQPHCSPLHLPSEARQVYNVIGAGDTVAATIALTLGSGHRMELGARLGNTAAGLVVEKQGTATITVDELCVHLSRQLQHGAQ